MTYVLSFINIDSGIGKLIGGDSQTHRQHGDRISPLQGSMLKKYFDPES
jgi:hypothetical protein